MRFVEHLIRNNAVSSAVVEDVCLRVGRKEKIVLKELSQSGVLHPEMLLSQMAGFYKLPLVDLESMDRDPNALRLVPFHLARRYGVYPLKAGRGALSVAVCDPNNFVVKDDLRALTGHQIELVLSSAESIHAAIERNYHLDGALSDAVEQLSEREMPESYSEEILSPGMAHMVADHCDSPISKTIQRILENAAQLKASDVHLEPRDNSVELRYRVDGELATIQTLPFKHHAAMVARIKIISMLDVAEQRRPQDGRGHLTFRERKIDLRVSTLPTAFGEKVVIRLLNQSSIGADTLETLGMDPVQLEAYSRAIAAKQGMILITGPTGSGKTTTLYSTLSRVHSEKSNITTIEDPIEYRLHGINQSQINPKIGITFSNMLRTILRQDPDVILVGEVRDRETADIAFRSSLTGHLVFSTLHANSATAAMTRLYDLGLEPYLVGSALLCIVAQRLVRVVCSSCRELYRPDDSVLEPFMHLFPGDCPQMFYRGRGCPKCAGTGFRGRQAIFEVMTITDEMRSAISTHAPEATIYRIARRAGFKTLADAALEKALQGVTTLEEALPFLPAQSSKESDLLQSVAAFIDQNQKEKLVIIRNEELAQKIMRLASPEDYIVIEPTGPKPMEEFAEQAPLMVLPDPLAESRNEAELDQNESSERRRAGRIARDFILQYRPSGASEWESSLVKNLSMGGCSFHSDRQFSAGQTIEMRLQLPSVSGLIPLRASVRHCRSWTDLDASFVGVAFESLGANENSKINNTLQYFLNKKVRVE